MTFEMSTIAAIEELRDKIITACEITDYTENVRSAREIAGVIDRYANRMTIYIDRLKQLIEQSQQTTHNESEGHA